VTDGIDTIALYGQPVVKEDGTPLILIDPAMNPTVHITLVDGENLEAIDYDSLLLGE